MACVIALFNVLFILAFLNLCICGSHALPKQILMDTDMDTADFFAILYLLKQNRSEVNLKAITISANAFTNAGHAVNQLYDLLYMMGRDDIQVGIGGEGGILFDGTILPDVGGYLSLAEQENSTAGGCRYRQAIPPGQGGQMDIDSNYGIRKDFLPQDGYTKEVSASEGVRVLVAEKAKPNKDINSTLDREYFISFLHALNSPHQTAKFNMKTEFPFYKETLYKNNIKGRLSGKPVILDLDMSPGDFVTLFYLLKMPQELIDLKGITITANGWANAATVDIIYDILHMMGRDDIPVGLGEFFALGQAYPTLNSTGDCKYRKAIPHGAGGYIDSDTLFGLARDLPRSPRRYTAHNSVKYGAPRDTEHPELRQPKAQEVLQNVMNGFESGRKVTVLTTGPLTNIATFLSSNTNSSSKIEQLYIVGGHIGQNEASDGGNVFTVLSNRKAEFNMYLDPLAAKQVLASKLNITMIPLKILRKASSFTRLLRELALAKDTPEAIFVHRLLSRMFQLHRSHHAYAHIGMFLGEVVGAAIMADRPQLKLVTQIRSVSVLANSEVGSDGWTIVDHRNGNPINLVEDIDSFAYYSHLSTILNEKNQSAIIASFSAQKKLWSTPPPQIGLPTL